MSKTFIGSAVCREFESEVPAAEEMLDHVVCSSEQCSFQMCLELGDGVMVVELFITGDREFQTPDAVIRNALDWKLILVFLRHVYILQYNRCYVAVAYCIFSRLLMSYLIQTNLSI